MKEFKEFLIKAHSSDNSASAKRFYGGIGFLCCIIMIWTIQPQLIAQLLYISATLIGLETISKIVRK